MARKILLHEMERCRKYAPRFAHAYQCIGMNYLILVGKVISHPCPLSFRHDDVIKLFTTHNGSGY